MPALNFMARFSDDVEEGNKNHSIRARRKDGLRIKMGDKLKLYTGMRSKACRLLRETVCTSVEEIRIVYARYAVCVAGRWLEPLEIKNLAEADGFASGSEFFVFFRDTHGPDFTGDLIHWKSPWA